MKIKSKIISMLPLHRVDLLTKKIANIAAGDFEYFWES